MLPSVIALLLLIYAGAGRMTNALYALARMADLRLHAYTSTAVTHLRCAQKGGDDT